MDETLDVHRPVIDNSLKTNIESVELVTKISETIFGDNIPKLQCEIFPFVRIRACKKYHVQIFKESELGMATSSS